MKEIVNSLKWIALVAVLSVIVVSIAHPETARARQGKEAQPITSGVRAPAAATGASALFGIDEGGILVKSDPARTLAVSSGAHWTRMEVNWAAIEPTQGGPYNWTDADKGLNPILSSGLQPVVYISYNPPWASTLPCAPINTNDQSVKDAFYNVIHATVSRYPGVPIWALYNEEDAANGNSDSTGQGCFGSASTGGINNNGVEDYKEYAIMLNLAWRAVHDANPNAKLATGALAFDNFRKADCPSGYPGGCEGGIFSYSFAGNLFGYMGAHQGQLPNGSKYMDMVLFNYYEIYGPYWQTKAKGVGIQAKANMLRSLMTQGGLTPVDLFVTETGETSSDSWVGLTGQARCVNITLARGAAAKLMGVVWWTFKDHADDAPFPQNTWKYGIVDQNMVPKPSYTAMQTITTELNGFNYVKTRSNKVGFKGVEAYAFKMGKVAKFVVVSSTINTSDPKYVSWHQNCALPRKNVKVTFKAKAVRIVNYMGGTPKTILDNKKGDKDKTVGKIAFVVGADPKIVQLNP